MSPSRSKPSRPISDGKRRLFTVTMSLLPVLFFGLLEGGLRLAGYGETYPLFVPVPGYEDYLYQNRDVARRYFSRQANSPTSQLDFFEADKDSATFRIFVQGGSTAAGYPFYYGGSFSRMLEQRLMQTFPERTIEVINTSMAAVNSYTLLDFSDEIITHEPDAVLIYAGHNEFYGALGVGSAESLGRYPVVVNLFLRLQSFRTVQALRAVLAWGAGLFGGRRAGEVPGSTLMERMVGEQSIPYGSPLYRLGLNQFRSNLGRLLATYRKYGIPVFVGTLAGNERDHKPFISSTAPTTDAEVWQRLLRRGLAAAAQGDTAAALDALDDAIALDSLAADAFYTRARLLDAQRRYDEARTAYIQAKDRDQLRFRASEDLNAIIRELAAEHGALIVDTQGALIQASPGGIIGANLMMEHLHPTVDGHFLLADAFYEALRRQQLIGDWSRPLPRDEARREVLLTPVDSLNGVLRVRKLMAGWPFQPPGVIDRSLDTMRATNRVEELAIKLSNGEISWREAHEALQRHYDRQGQHHRALQTALALIQEYPFAAPYYLLAGNTLLRQRRADEALIYFEAANDLDESAVAQRMIGSILLEQARRAQSQPQVRMAITHLERALALNPNDPAGLYNLGGAYALTGQYDKARQTVTRLLTMVPNHADAQRLFASLPPS